MIQSWQQYKEEVTNYSVDFNVKTSELSTSVSSVSWSVESGSAVISNESLSSDIASAFVTTNSADCSLIKVKATLADSQVAIHYFKVKASDPVCINDGSKY